jgi:putative polyketide hydroxylase
MRVENTHVLIVGAGLTGLSAAFFLREQGVSVTLVERRHAPLRHPRARTVNPRTVELFRRSGLDRSILAARAVHDRPGALLIRAQTLCGPEQWRRLAVPESVSEDVSPSPWAFIDQDKLEDLLCARARELGADIRFGAELMTFQADDCGVTARVQDTDGSRYAVRARYLIGADGHSSRVRTALAIPSDGAGVLGNTITFLFEADLTAALAGRQLQVGHLDRPLPGTVLLPHNDAGQWVFSSPCPSPAGDGAASLSESSCVDMVRAAVGDPELPVAIVPQLADGTRVLSYQICAQVARRFRAGLVFLAGDAAHVMPPAGAFGASTGIQDAHNLAWKLAAVLSGQAGDGLLDSYHDERQQVARFTLTQALWQLRERTGREVPRLSPEGPADYDAVVFGQRYRSPAVVPVAATTVRAAGDAAAVSPADLRGQPGTRIRHATVCATGAPLSTIDLPAGGFVLLAGSRSAGWHEAASAAAASLGVPVDCYQLEADLRDLDGLLERDGVVPAHGALLIRPDGIVAWRSDGAGARAEPPDQLERVLANLLSRHRSRPPEEGEERHEGDDRDVRQPLALLPDGAAGLGAAGRRA